jgi:DNA-directed RNA polymerase subunit RPC12/RpoP
LTRTYPYELAIVRGRLEADGIYCFVVNELILQVQPFYSFLIGGVKLQVRESDLQEVSYILKETGYLPSNDSKQLNTTFNSEEIMISDGTQCPYCGSGEISEFRTTLWPFTGWPFILGSLIVFLSGNFGPGPFPGKACHCFECGCNSKIKR